MEDYKDSSLDKTFYLTVGNPHKHLTHAQGHSALALQFLLGFSMRVLSTFNTTPYTFYSLDL